MQVRDSRLVVLTTRGDILKSMYFLHLRLFHKCSIIIGTVIACAVKAYCRALLFIIPESEGSALKLKSASPPFILLLFIAIAFLLNLAFVSFFELSESYSMAITAVLLIGIILILNYLYKVYKASSPDETEEYIIQQEDNFHEFSFKAEFAKLREKFNYEITTNDDTHFGREFDRLLAQVEKDLLGLARNPKNMIGEPDYHGIVTDQVMLALLDKISMGNYIRKGVPDFDTQFFVSICRNIIASEFESGNLSEEKHHHALQILEREIQNGKVIPKK